MKNIKNDLIYKISKDGISLFSLIMKRDPLNNVVAIIIYVNPAFNPK